MLFSTTGMVKRAYNMREEVNLFFVIKNKKNSQLHDQNCELIFNFTGHHSTPNDMNLKLKEGGNRSQRDLSIFV
jgi:hypothetical protein